MGTISEKLNHLINSKTAIDKALRGKGVTIPDQCTFRDYAGLVKSIPAGKLNIAFGEEAPDDTTTLWVKCDDRKTVRIMPNLYQEFHHTSSAKLPTGASGVGVAAVGSKIYTFGGATGADSCSSRICIFDTTTETLTYSNTTLPKGVAYMAIAAVGTKIYLFGGCLARPSSGSAYSNAIYRYDTETDTVTTLNTTLPYSACCIVGAAVGKNIYLFGGKYYETTPYRAITKFDTETETITTLNSTISAIYSPAITVFDGKIYLFGGFYSNSKLYASSSVRVFDPETETITTLPNRMAQGVGLCTACVAGKYIYLFGGFVYGSAIDNSTVNTYFFRLIQVFDTEDETTVALAYSAAGTLPTELPANCVVSGTSVNDRIYLFGGYSSDGDRLRAIEVYTPIGSFLRDQIILCTDNAEHKIPLWNSGNISMSTAVGAVYAGSDGGSAVETAACLYVDGAWTEI